MGGTLIHNDLRPRQCVSSHTVDVFLSPVWGQPRFFWRLDAAAARIPDGHQCLLHTGFVKHLREISHQLDGSVHNLREDAVVVGWLWQRAAVGIGRQSAICILLANPGSRRLSNSRR